MTKGFWDQVKALLLTMAVLFGLTMVVMLPTSWTQLVLSVVYALVLTLVGFPAYLVWKAWAQSRQDRRR